MFPSVWYPAGRVADVYSENTPVHGKPRVIILDAVGEMVVPEIFDAARWYALTKHFTVERDGQCGVIDSRGHRVAPMRDGYYSEIDSPRRTILAEEFR